MPTGFIYVVTTLRTNYMQKAFCSVPTVFGDRIYFGPCKRSMRPRIKAGDYVFGVSPSSTPARRIIFVAQIEEIITFGSAYNRFSDLRGPEGPIHVSPINGNGSFPRCSYEHIPGSMHGADWQNDLASRELDRFFVCYKENGWLGRWLGPDGPEIDDEILAFLNKCAVYGSAGHLGLNTGTLTNPIAFGGLYTGLHLETNRPEELVALCGVRTTSEDLHIKLAHSRPPQLPQRKASNCGGQQPSVSPKGC